MPAAGRITHPSSRRINTLPIFERPFDDENFFAQGMIVIRHLDPGTEPDQADLLAGSVSGGTTVIK